MTPPPCLFLSFRITEKPSIFTHESGIDESSIVSLKVKTSKLLQVNIRLNSSMHLYNEQTFKWTKCRLLLLTKLCDSSKLKYVWLSELTTGIDCLLWSLLAKALWTTRVWPLVENGSSAKRQRLQTQSQFCLNTFSLVDVHLRWHQVSQETQSSEFWFFRTGNWHNTHGYCIGMVHASLFICRQTYIPPSRSMSLSRHTATFLPFFVRTVILPSWLHVLMTLGSFCALCTRSCLMLVRDSLM